MVRLKSLQSRAALLIAAATIACGESTSPFASLQLTNVPDEFVFLGQTFERTVTDTLHYTWVHTGTVGLVNRVITQGDVVSGSNIAAGSARIVIKDAAGTQVFAGDIAVAANDTTATGTTGNWSIDLIMLGVRGNVIVQVLKGR